MLASIYNLSVGWAVAAYYVNTNWWNELDQPTRDLISATTLPILIVLGTIYGGIAMPAKPPLSA